VSIACEVKRRKAVAVDGKVGGQSGIFNSAPCMIQDPTLNGPCTVIDRAILEKYNASLPPRKLKLCDVVLVMEL